MNITKANPHHVRRPSPKRPRYDWAPILRALAAEPGVWLSVPLADLPDRTMQKNQFAIRLVARRHIGMVQTQGHGDLMLVRLTVQKPDME